MACLQNVISFVFGQQHGSKFKRNCRLWEIEKLNSLSIIKRMVFVCRLPWANWSTFSSTQRQKVGLIWTNRKSRLFNIACETTRSQLLVLVSHIDLNYNLIPVKRRLGSTFLYRHIAQLLIIKTFVGKLKNLHLGECCKLSEWCNFLSSFAIMIFPPFKFRKNNKILTSVKVIWCQRISFL